MKNLIIWIFFTMACSQAVGYTCAGKVTGLSVNPKSGHILAEYIGPLKWPKLCSVNSTSNGVDPESCKVIFATLLAAQMSNKSVMLWFNDEKDCSQESHTPWYNLEGWYFGPKIEE